LPVLTKTGYDAVEGDGSDEHARSSVFIDGLLPARRARPRGGGSFVNVTACVYTHARCSGDCIVGYPVDCC